MLLLACKGIAYGVSLSSFRGGPTFPALFFGAAGGVALSHLPGLPLVDGIAMGGHARTISQPACAVMSPLLTSAPAPHLPRCGTVSEQAQIHGSLNRVQAGGHS